MLKIQNIKKLINIIGFASLGLLILGCENSNNDTGQRPNILMISIDDLNNWIEPLGGHPQAQTPNLKRFAYQAINFTNAYTASPSCNPSRTALMTGKHPHATGVYTNTQIWRHVLPNEITLPEYFKQAGYWTAGAGKIYHNNMPDPRSWNDYYPSKIKHMPDYYLPHFDPTSESKYFKKMDNEIREDDPKGITFNMPVFDNMYIAFDFEPLPFKTNQTGDYASVKWISDQIKREHDKPFFLACGIYRPHLPWYVPQEFYNKFPLDDIQLPEMYKDDLGDLPELGKKIAHRGNYHKNIIKSGLWEKAVQGYLASIYYSDHLVGLLMKSLEESKYADNTIVVIYSDHGWQLGEKEHWRKFALWENVINSVLMIKVPKGVSGYSDVKNGNVCNQNVSLVDIFPTLTDLSGLPLKEGVTGKSLAPLLSNPEKQWPEPVITSLNNNHYSVIQDQWHYINYDGEDEELYNLREDPNEWYNRADDASLKNVKQNLKDLIPKSRHEYVRTDPIRWEDVLSGKIKF